MEGGQPWQVVGTVTVSPESDRVEISIRDAENGIFAADAIRLRSVEPALPNLNTLRLEYNPLNNRAHELYTAMALEPAAETRVVTIDTDDLTIESDGAIWETFYGASYTREFVDGMAIIKIDGDLSIPGDTIRVVGSNALSIQVSNNVFIDDGAVFDLSAVGTQPGPGGGTPGSGADAQEGVGIRRTGGGGGGGGAGGAGGAVNFWGGGSGAPGIRRQRGPTGHVGRVRCWRRNRR